jgi:TonB-dependent receptor
VDENNFNIRADLSLPLPSYNSKDNFLKVGGALSDSERNFFQRGYEMYWNGSSQLTFINTGNPQDYLAPTNYPYVIYRNYPVNIVYEGAQTITAAYAMFDWSAAEWLRLISGFRWEYTDLTLSGVNQTLNQPLEPGSINQGDILPSISAMVPFTDKLQFRAAWSQTVVRPTYREIAPVYIYDIPDGELIFGNPDLVMSKSMNYDLRLEYYPRPGEIASLSLFMKQIENPIELYQVNSSDVIYNNSSNADVYGVEFEWGLRMDRLWEPLEEFTLGGNAAYIYSEVPISEEDQEQRFLTYLDTSTSRPLYDQPEYVLNANLTWDHPATGTAITIAGGVVGERLVLYGLTTPDQYEQPAPQLDVFFNQKLSKRWRMKFSAKNLLNPTFETSQKNAAADNQTQVLKSYTKGMTFGLSVAYEF